MPIVQSLMSNLVSRYGKKRGEDIYYAMEAEGKGPFAKGAKYHGLHQAFAAKHGLPAIESPKRKTKRRGKK